MEGLDLVACLLSSAGSVEDDPTSQCDCQSSRLLNELVKQLVLATAADYQGYSAYDWSSALPSLARVCSEKLEVCRRQLHRYESLGDLDSEDIQFEQLLRSQLFDDRVPLKNIDLSIDRDQGMAEYGCESTGDHSLQITRWLRLASRDFIALICLCRIAVNVSRVYNKMDEIIGGLALVDDCIGSVMKAFPVGCSSLMSPFDIPSDHWTNTFDLILAARFHLSKLNDDCFRVNNQGIDLTKHLHSLDESIERVIERVVLSLGSINEAHILEDTTRQDWLSNSMFRKGQRVSYGILFQMQTMIGILSDLHVHNSSMSCIQGTSLHSEFVEFAKPYWLRVSLEVVAMTADSVFYMYK